MNGDDLIMFHRLALRVVKQLQQADPGQALLITSARAREGKSYVAERLATALSQQALGRVALVACSPGSHAATGRPDDPTLTELIDGTASEARRASLAGGDTLRRVNFGAGDAATLYRVGGLTRALGELRSRFTVAVLDGPTIADCGGLADCANASLLVINAARTQREIVRGSMQSSDFGGAKLLGAVLNEMPQYVPRWLYRRSV